MGHLAADVAALALRAAQLQGGRSRPANATVHFLGVAGFDGPVTVTAGMAGKGWLAVSVLGQLRTATPVVDPGLGAPRTLPAAVPELDAVPGRCRR